MNRFTAPLLLLSLLSLRTGDAAPFYASPHFLICHHTQIEYVDSRQDITSSINGFILTPLCTQQRYYERHPKSKDMAVRAPLSGYIWDPWYTQNPNTIETTVDTDGDGQLSLSEVQYAGFVHHGLSGTVIKQLFEEIDTNHDGLLSFADFDHIRPLVLARAESAAAHYMKTVDTNGDGVLSLAEAQAYILREYGIGSRDVERVWKLVVPYVDQPMDAVIFSKLRRRIRGMTIRLARQIMKSADTNSDGHISLGEAQAVAFEQEGIGAEDVAAMLASVDDNEDGELNAPEFADFERIVRARAVETSKRALKVVDADGSGTLTLDEAKRIAFEHYGFDENILGPFFAQADENEDGALDAVEFAGFRSVIRSRAVKQAVDAMPTIDTDGDGLLSLKEAEEKTRREDDMETTETKALFNIADQNKSGKLDRVEFADFIRLVRLSSIKFATDHFNEFDANGDGAVTEEELTELITEKYGIPKDESANLFQKVDVDTSGDLIPAEIVDYRHQIRSYVRARAEQEGKPSPFPTLMSRLALADLMKTKKKTPTTTTSRPMTISSIKEIAISEILGQPDNETEVASEEIPEAEVEDGKMKIEEKTTTESHDVPEKHVAEERFVKPTEDEGEEEEDDDETPTSKPRMTVSFTNFKITTRNTTTSPPPLTTSTIPTTHEKLVITTTEDAKGESARIGSSEEDEESTTSSTTIPTMSTAKLVMAEVIDEVSATHEKDVVPVPGTVESLEKATSSAEAVEDEADYIQGPLPTSGEEKEDEKGEEEESEAALQAKIILLRAKAAERRTSTTSSPTETSSTQSSNEDEDTTVHHKQTASTLL